jgi:hypothetical protein
MTIAAGFVFDKGVLLCADTEIETPASKNLGIKVGAFAGDWGIVAAAIAGHVDYALAAFQKLEREIVRNGPGEDLIGTIEDSLATYYAENVFGHPQYQSYPEQHAYSFLLAVREEGKISRLYVTNDTVLHEIGTYRCEGVGRDVGHSAIRTLYQSGEMTEDQAVAIGAYTLATVKDNVPGCGGPSTFLIVPSVGEVYRRSEDALVLHLENVCGWFDQSARQFLMDHMCQSEEEFGKHLLRLNSECQHIRKIWKEQLTRKAVQSTPESTIRDR